MIARSTVRRVLGRAARRLSTFPSMIHPAEQYRPT
jgi:hypothetical protein